MSCHDASQLNTSEECHACNDIRGNRFYWKNNVCNNGRLNISVTGSVNVCNNGRLNISVTESVNVCNLTGQIYGGSRSYIFKVNSDKDNQLFYSRGLVYLKYHGFLVPGTDFSCTDPNLGQEQCFACSFPDSASSNTYYYYNGTTCIEKTDGTYRPFLQLQKTQRNQ